MKYIITVDYGNEKHAGSKAPNDIVMIARDNNYVVKKFKNPPSNRFIRFLWRYFGPRKEWLRFLNEVTAKDVILYQHPTHNEEYFFRKFIPKFQKKGAKVVVLIHDLDYVRYQYEENTKKRHNEVSLLKSVDCVICHNQQMLKKLVDAGVQNEKLVDLQFFDYLTCGVPQKECYERKWNVCIAGNLNKLVNDYIYKAADNNKELSFELYGNSFYSHAQNQNINYHGSFLPDELINKINADFGVVWAGMDSETCSGQLGAYLRYNNPHKASLYLAAGIPLIVWNQSAIAKFVSDYNCGIIIDSLNNLEDIIKDINDEEYKSIRDATQKISLKIQKGDFFKEALNAAERKITK